MLKPGYILISGLCLAAGLLISTAVRVAEQWPYSSLSAQLPLISSIPKAWNLKDPTALEECHHPPFEVHIFSFDPFIAILENFMPESERKHVLDLASPQLKESWIRFANGTGGLSPYRTSKSAMLHDFTQRRTSDPVLRCIMHRTSCLLGPLPQKNYSIQATVYGPGGQFKPHYDWYGGRDGYFSRSNTVFAILGADCQDCGTQFPDILVDWSTKPKYWCQFFDCGRRELTAKAITGNAVVWRNMFANGTGDWRSWHAGMPTDGFKAGLNIWTEEGVEMV